MANNPNQPTEPDFRPPIDYKDEPPPEVKANTGTRNSEGEGDDAARPDENEGEGNRTADEKYRKGVKQHLKKGNVAKEADDAKRALENDDQRKDLEDAEEAARKGQIH